YQIEAPAIGVAPAIGAPVIGSSSSATEIGAIVIRVCSQLAEHGKILLKLDDHGKMFHNHGKMLEQISMSTVGDNTLPLRDNPLLGQYQFSTPEKTAKHKQEGGNEKEDGKRKKVEPIIKKGLKKEAFTDDQFDHVPLIQLKTLIPKILKKGLANRVPRKRRVEFLELENIQSTAKNLLQQVALGDGLEAVNDLMVDDDVEVGREVNFKAISSEYSGDLLEWKKGDEKDSNEKNDVEEKVKFEEEQPQVAEEEDSEPPTVVVYYNNKKYETMVVAEVAKTDIVFFNQEEVVGEASQASVNQTTIIYVEEQTLEASVDQTTTVSVEEQTIVVAQAEELILMELKVDVTLKKRHALTDEEINERAFKMTCQMNQLHAHLDELLP
ncbi:hypothetical protein GIB67_002520, partial [Kingdonia uniflora]